MDKRPLEGRRILLTRTEEQATSSARLLAERGAIPLVWSAISVNKIDSQDAVMAAIIGASSYDLLLFTSANAARFFDEALRQHGASLSLFDRAKVGAIGQRTAEAVASLGKHVDFVAERFVAENFAQTILARIPPQAKVLLPRARVAREVVVDALSAAGHSVDVLPIYETTSGDSAEALASLIRQGVDAICFSSSSTVEHFAAALAATAASLEGVTLAAIGPVTAHAMRAHGLAPDLVSDVFTLEALIDALERKFSGR